LFFFLKTIKHSAYTSNPKMFTNPSQIKPKNHHNPHPNNFTYPKKRKKKERRRSGAQISLYSGQRSAKRGFPPDLVGSVKRERERERERSRRPDPADRPNPVARLQSPSGERKKNERDPCF
jgi:hypothetical protein